MPQSSSQLPQPDWVSIPFAKFSHNTSPCGTRNFIWNHVGLRNDLDFVISNVRSRDERSGNYDARPVMRISAGAELLEYQDLGELVSFIRDYDPATGTEPPVQVVIKSPFLAMRFPKSPTTVRRIQLKFRNEIDFGRARIILEELGLPVADTGPSTGAIARTVAASPAPSVFSTTSNSSLRTVATSIPRSSSAVHGDSVSFDAPSCSSLHSASTRGFGEPLCRERSMLENNRPSDTLAYSTSSVLVPSTSSISGAASGNRLAIFQDSLKQLPSLYLSQVEKEAQSQQGPSASIQLFNSSMSHPGGSHFVQDMSCLEGGPVSHAGAPIRQLSASPFFQASRSTPTSKLFDFRRPTSTPTAPGDIYELCIPPRRVLPFPRPRAISTVLMPAEQTSLPKPISVESTDTMVDATEGAADHDPVAPVPGDVPKKRVAQRKKATPVANEQDANVPAKPCSEAIVKDNIPEPSVDEEPSPLAAKSAASTRPPSTTGLQSKAAAPKKRAPPIPRPASSAKKAKTADHGTQTQTLSGRDHTVAGRCSPNHEHNKGKSSEVEIPPGNYLDHLEAFVTQHKARACPKEFWGNRRYEDADDEERQVILNDFICANLDNEDFLRLCEDTEKAWRRIGLGM